MTRITKELTDDELEQLFCEITGLITGINPAATDTNRALVWFKRGYRTAIQTYIDSLSAELPEPVVPASDLIQNVDGLLGELYTRDQLLSALAAGDAVNRQLSEQCDAVSNELRDTQAERDAALAEVEIRKEFGDEQCDLAIKNAKERDAALAQIETLRYEVDSIAAIKAERDAALAQIKTMEDTWHAESKCECSTEDACRFARERDAALAKLKESK